MIQASVGKDLIFCFGLLAFQTDGRIMGPFWTLSEDAPFLLGKKSWWFAASFTTVFVFFFFGWNPGIRFFRGSKCVRGFLFFICPRIWINIRRHPSRFSKLTGKSKMITTKCNNDNNNNNNLLKKYQVMGKIDVFKH